MTDECDWLRFCISDGVMVWEIRKVLAFAGYRATVDIKKSGRSHRRFGKFTHMVLIKP